MNMPLKSHGVNASQDQDTDSAEDRRLAKLKSAANYTSVQARVLGHNLLATSLASHGINRRRAGAGAGVSKNRIDQWCGSDSNGHSSITIGRLLTLGQTSERGREAARSVLVALLSHLYPTPEAPDAERELPDLLDDLHAELGDVARAWREAWADRHVTPEEAARLDRELADVVDAATTMRLELARKRGA